MHTIKISIPEGFSDVKSKHKVEFYQNDTVAEIKEQLKAFGLPVSGSRRMISCRLYNRVLFGLDHWYRSVEQ